MDTVPKEAGSRGPLPIDIRNGSEGAGENRYDVKREITEGLSLPAGTRTDDVVAQARQKKRDLTGFWVIGILINIVVMTAFVVWAVGQWRKSGR